MEKDLNYFFSLPYKIEIVPIPDELGGGYSARLPEIGRFAITGDGDTIEEAIQNLNEAKEQRFEEYLNRGIEIPEPKPEFEEYSGRFVVRIPKVLHYQLAASAKANQASLNHFVTYLLSTNFQLHQNLRYFEQITDAVSCIQEVIWNIAYSFPKKETRKSLPEFDQKLEKLVA